MRQAVVVIHGMGEQKAMDFLRGFVKVALSAPRQREPAYWSKPDQMSELFEVRRLHARQTDDRPDTDFYEYYWAHHMEGNLPRHLWTLVRTLLVRWPGKVSGSLLLMYLLGWAVIGVLVAVIVLSGIALFGEDGLTLAIVLTALGVSGVLGVAIRGFIRFLVKGFAVTHFGDVARYLDRAPRNVAVRQKIRAEAVELLRRIHKSGRYDRIVVVGHSLGSLIGYDALSFLYPDFNSQHLSPANPGTAATMALREAGEKLRQQPTEDNLKVYRQAQQAAWIEQRRNGNPWLVTDFVSVGSPLSHAEMLLARSRTTLDQLTIDRELPTSPPMLDDHGYGYERTYKTKSGDRTLWLLHHAALFGVTRWTNIYFPAHGGVFGDWFAGPVAPVFGAGIKDVAIESGKWNRLVPLLPHILYFSHPTERSGKVLRDALNLNARVWLSKVNGNESAGEAPTQADGRVGAPALREGDRDATPAKHATERWTRIQLDTSPKLALHFERRRITAVR